MTLLPSALRTALMALFAALVTACGGIPLTTLPRLVRLPTALMEAPPAEFRVARLTVNPVQGDW